MAYFTVQAKSEFTPTPSIYLRAEYIEFLAMLRPDRNFILVGDSGIGKSTLLRFVFACFAFGLVFDETTGAWISKAARRQPVFWAKESGQYVFSDINGIQHQGATGQGDEHEHAWKASDVWLLVDGEFENVFLPKTSKMCGLSSPEDTVAPKISNAIRVVQSPWREEELESFLQQSDSNYLRRCMQPYLDCLEKEAELRSESSEEDVETSVTNVKPEKAFDPACVLAYDEVDAWMQKRSNGPDFVTISSIGSTWSADECT